MAKRDETNQTRATRKGRKPSVVKLKSRTVEAKARKTRAKKGAKRASFGKGNPGGLRRNRGR